MDETQRARASRAVDRAEIAAILNAYAHGVDRKDGALRTSCFHPDATFQYIDQPPAPVSAFFEAAAPNGEGLLTTSHNLSNHLVVFDDEGADSQIYFSAYHLVAADAPDRPPLFPAKGHAYGVVIGGRYLDRFVRFDGGWRILRRRLVFEWSFNTEGPEIPLPTWDARDTGFRPSIGQLT